MTYVDWEIKAKAFGNCNCNYGCPCQFSVLPTHGNCKGLGTHEIEQGHFGDVRLDGLRFVAIYAFPGAIHQGNGEAQFIIDERADEAQREALLTILSGQETEPAATVFNIFDMMVSTKHETLYLPIEFEYDYEGRSAKVLIGGLLESYGEPIRNPVTGAENRVRIDFENGFEFTVAEMGSGRTKSTGTIKLDLEDTYGQFNYLHLNPYGIVK